MKDEGMIKKNECCLTNNVILLSVLSVLFSFQILIILSFISSLFPLQSTLGENLIPNVVDYLQPEREILLYRTFIVGSIVIQAMLLFLFRQKLNDTKWSCFLRRGICFEACCVGLMIFSALKLLSYPNHSLAQLLFYVSVVSGFLIKTLWLWPKEWVSFYRHVMSQEKILLICRKLTDMVFPFLIISFIFIPDRMGTIAKIFVRDRLYHLDGFIMAPGWAALNGFKMNVDILSQYGVGMPTMVAYLTRLFGGFSYENVLLVFTLLTSLYFILCYVFLRLWIKSSIIAVIGVLLALKYQMFWYESSDFIVWKYASPSVIRYFFDILFFIFLSFFISNRKKKYLILSCLTIGMALFYVTDTGVYLFVSLWAFLVFSLIVPHIRPLIFERKKDYFFVLFLGVIPALIACLLFYCFLGTSFFQASYWQDISEFINLFMQGHGALPIYDGLQQGKYFIFWQGIMMGLLYIFTVIVCLSLIILKKMKQGNMLVIILGIYGLCSYHYWICRSAPHSYLAVCIPAVLILCFWMKYWTETMSLEKRQLILFGLLGVTIFLFVTNHGFIRYPNIFNLTGANFIVEKNEMQQELNISQDADMIKRLTAEGARIPLVSSFEMAILMKADRPSYFYYYPILNPRLLSSKDFGGLKLVTQRQFEKTMQQLQDDEPDMIFFEKKLILGEIPPIYYQYHKELTGLIKYVHEHYMPVETGKYIMAFKRRPRK